MSTLAAPPPEALLAEAEPPAVRPRPLATWLALALILAVGAFTHLTRLDLIEFKADEAQVASLAMAVAHGQWPAASIATSNGGLDNPPLPLYLFGLAALFTRGPAWQAAVSAGLDLLAIAIVFVVGRRWFGERAGLAAAALYAAAAYPAMFARKLAGPYLQPLFAVLLVWALLAIATRPRSSSAFWPWAAAILAFGALVQIHLGALLLAPVLLVIMLTDLARRYRRGPWDGLAGAALGGLVVGAGFAPYLVYEARHRAGFLGMFAGYVQGTPAWTLEAFRFVWTTISSPGYGDLTGAASGLFNAESWPAFYVAVLGGLVVAGGLGLAVWRWREPRFGVLALFVLLPLALTLHHGPGLQIHYFAFLLPALFLLGGAGFDALVGAVPALRLPGFALLGLLLAVQVAGFRHFTQFVERRALPDSYGLPLAYQERLYGKASRLAAGRRVVAGVAGRDQQEPARYFLPASVPADPSEGLLLPAAGGVYTSLSAGSPGAHAVASAVAPAYTEPLPGGAEAAVYVLTSDTPATLARSIGAAPMSGPAVAGADSALPGAAGAPPVSGPAAGASGPLAGATPASAAPAWANGVHLAAVAAPRGLPGQLASVWQVTQAVDPSTLFFSQLVDGAGKQWLDHDAVPAPAADWQPGDTIVLLTPAALPPDAPRQAYWWSAGMYTAGGRRVTLTDGASELRLARLKGGAAAPAASALTPAGAVFGGAIRLEGYTVQPDAVTLQWTSVSAVDKDYTVFVHALDAAGNVVAQADAQPDRYPTSLWDPGESVLDRHALTIPPGASIEVGLYDLASGQRLRLAGGADHVVLQAAAR